MLARGCGRRALNRSDEPVMRSILRRSGCLRRSSSAASRCDSGRSIPTTATEMRRPDSRPCRVQGSATSFTDASTDLAGSRSGTRCCARSHSARAPAWWRGRSGSRRHGRPRPSSAANPSPSAARADGEVDRAAAAGEIVIEPWIVRLQPVVGGVVDAAEIDSVGPIWLPSAV